MPGAVGLVFGAALLAVTSKEAGRQLAWLRGESLRMDGDVDAGPATQGETRSVLIMVKNASGADVHLIGGTASCACVATDDLPITVPARGSATVCSLRDNIRSGREIEQAFRGGLDFWLGQPRP